MCRYDGGNYQGKDMAHMQKTLATQMAGHCRGEGMKAHLARMALAVLPRGGGDGDAIRMTILDLLRNNGIKEGHRPGIECPFLAQWHQKLHSNTTMVRSPRQRLPRPPAALPAAPAVLQQAVCYLGINGRART